MELTVQQLAEKVGGVVSGDATLILTAVASLEEARVGDVSFCKDAKHEKLVAGTRASAVMLPEDWDRPCGAPAVIRVADPNAACMIAAATFAPPPVVRAPGVHPTAVIAEGVTLGRDVHVGAWTVIEQGAVIGDRCVIEAQVFIGERVKIGEDSHIYPQVTLREGTLCGKRVILHCGVRLGSDGYGYNTAIKDGKILIDKIPQLGIVELGDDVEIGCNTTIDRARFGRTRVGNNTKIDNLVQLGHNVQVGDCSGIIAQAGIAGSTHIGSGCLIWAQAGVSGHLHIHDGAQVGPASGLSKDVPPGEYYIGLPALPKREFAATLLLPRQVEKLKAQVAALTAKLAAMTPAE